MVEEIIDEDEISLEDLTDEEVDEMLALIREGILRGAISLDTVDCGGCPGDKGCC